MNICEKDNFFLKIFSKYAIIPIASGIFAHTFLYFLSAFIVDYFEFKKTNVILNFDFYIPQLSFFVIPYVFFYIYIVLGPFLIFFFNRKALFRYLVSLEIGSIIGFFFFIIYPTYVLRSSFEVVNMFDQFLQYIHDNDVSGNAFPSFHCFISWLIYVTLRNCNICTKFKIIFFIISFLICISTVFTKQHGFIDICGGVILAEVLWFATKNSRLIEIFEKFFTKINDKIWS